jgi:hypothetical protein
VNAAAGRQEGSLLFSGSQIQMERLEARLLIRKLFDFPDHFTYPYGMVLESYF